MENFTLEGYLQSVPWQDTATKLYDSPPIILRGFVRRADGIGSHLPNLYDKVFCEYKNVAFTAPPDRKMFMHTFLHEVTDNTISAYTKDFEWIHKFRQKENKHITEPQNFKNAKLLHVSGFSNTMEEEYQNNFLDIYKYKKNLNAETYFYLMWENSDFKPLDTLFNSYDNIIVTNTWLYENLQERYPGASIYNIEHIARYYDAPSSGTSEKFTYGFSGGLWERKCPEIVIKSYNQIKTSEDLLKVHSRQNMASPVRENLIKNLIKEDPNYIDFTLRTLPDNEFSVWWDSLNCYIAVSGGESYSVTPRQAILQGIPVILSANTAHLDLLDVPGVLPVECTSAAIEYAQYSHMIGQSQYQPQQDQISKQMIEVKKNYKYWKAEAQKGSKILQKKLSVNRIKQQWKDLLNGI
tara:strand:+ start:1181 stop:2407 length:1227 start_codon:yes stop_codon:yes gene_type:complete